MYDYDFITVILLLGISINDNIVINCATVTLVWQKRNCQLHYYSYHNRF
jgi:hypothetical protein